MTNEYKIFPYFKKMYEKLQNKDFVIDKSNVKMIELLYPTIENLNPQQSILNFKVKKTNEIYIQKELEWYLSQDLSIQEIGKYARIWKDVANKNGYINSNYGWIVFSKDNFNQYEHCLNELIFNKESRRAEMIYQRPSIWYEYNKDGMNDFICTNNVLCLIRNNKLLYIINQRSSDIIYGFFNDFYWHCYVYMKLYNDLKNKEYYDLEIGEIIFKPDSLHIYERHFNLLEKIIKEFLINE